MARYTHTLQSKSALSRVESFIIFPMLAYLSNFYSDFSSLCVFIQARKLVVYAHVPHNKIQCVSSSNIRLLSGKRSSLLHTCDCIYTYTYIYMSSSLTRIYCSRMPLISRVRRIPAGNDRWATISQEINTAVCAIRLQQPPAGKREPKDTGAHASPEFAINSHYRRYINAA